MTKKAWARAGTWATLINLCQEEEETGVLAWWVEGKMMRTGLDDVGNQDGGTLERCVLGSTRKQDHGDILPVTAASSLSLTMGVNLLPGAVASARRLTMSVLDLSHLRRRGRDPEAGQD